MLLISLKLSLVSTSQVWYWQSFTHRLIKTQIGHARDFAWYRGQRPSPARVILSHERVHIHARENLCSYATNPPHFRVRELLLCDILITRAGDGRWPRYQAKSLACPGCAFTTYNHSIRWSLIRHDVYIFNFTRQMIYRKFLSRFYIVYALQTASRVLITIFGQTIYR